MKVIIRSSLVTVLLVVPTSILALACAGWLADGLTHDCIIVLPARATHALLPTTIIIIIISYALLTT
jgi:hypothetical protein